MSMNIAFLTTSPQTLTQDLCDLANLEGHLLAVRALMRLDAGNEKGEGETHSPNQCEVASVAYHFGFAWQGGRFDRPACEPLINALHQLGTAIDPAVWQSSVDDGCNDAEIEREQARVNQFNPII
ncbi:hypothetical protein FHU12_5281 [Serratia marcescens]|uniref:Uncharacterized protein n=1 Tax=Serratia marcescens TaxID=615 RepID=A0AA46QDR3_SERMA|nr:MULTISPECIES: hypothetical protein [Serratia]TQI87580.1 hypothetical protein FHU12_5281 [Serratia marcescens]